jgi:hypothetical protein
MAQRWLIKALGARRLGETERGPPDHDHLTPPSQDETDWSRRITITFTPPAHDPRLHWHASSAILFDISRASRARIHSRPAIEPPRHDY